MGARIAWVQPGETVENPPPQSLSSMEPEYQLAASMAVPPAFVVEIPNGRAIGEHGAVVTSDNKLLSDLSLPVGSLRDWLLRDGRDAPGGDEFFVDAALPAHSRYSAVAVLSAYWAAATSIGCGTFHLAPDFSTTQVSVLVISINFWSPATTPTIRSKRYRRWELIGNE